jgi:hypothetical protein
MSMMKMQIMQWAAWAVVVAFGWFWWQRRNANQRRSR